MSFKILTEETQAIMQSERENGCIGFLVSRRRGQCWVIEPVKYSNEMFATAIKRLEMTLHEKSEALAIDSCLLNLKATGRAPVTREDMESLREMGVWK